MSMRSVTEPYSYEGRRGESAAPTMPGGPVTSPVDLTLLAEHRRGHGALYEALNQGRIDADRLRKALAVRPQPKAADGRPVLAVGVSPWLRPDAPTSPDRLFCHVYGRSGRSSDQFIPGWPYSFVAALETCRTSWCQLLDSVRLGPEDDVAEVTARQVRRVVNDLIGQGRCEDGAPGILVVFDAGYDAPRTAYLLTGMTSEDVDLRWQAFLRCFDLEHTFRFVKQTLGWTVPGSVVPRPRPAARSDVGESTRRPESVTERNHLKAHRP